MLMMDANAVARDPKAHRRYQFREMKELYVKANATPAVTPSVYQKLQGEG